jgi:hypothetical protein
MSTQEVADKLVGMCREGKFDEVYKKLFADDAVAIEPDSSPAPRTEGKPALLAKAAQFNEMVEEMHGFSVSEPIVADTYFACTMLLDATMKGQGRQKMVEVCVYGVKDGKVVSEQFFY